MLTSNTLKGDDFLQFSVKNARNKCKYTREQMANLTGLSKKAYTQYENNPKSIPIGIALKIAEITKISVDEIFFG